MSLSDSPMLCQVSSGVEVGDTMIVFNSHDWKANGYDDAATKNSQFFQEAEILWVEPLPCNCSTCRREQVATVRFPDGRESRGHFTSMMTRPEESR